uniref:Ovule protein n=1 Tax=Strongyloides venezuelensis TaxID=75913 RepID=A0A0K0G665_STRVS
MYPNGYMLAGSYHPSRVSYLMKWHVGTCVLDQKSKKQTHLFYDNLLFIEIVTNNVYMLIILVRCSGYRVLFSISRGVSECYSAPLIYFFSSTYPN